ncbi:MAG TPA: DUF6599 family protein [Candidatus Acidoferrales bacterium]|nr:DUF6599 family protein [Candidatus Acidoferrales bacterium]
MFRIIILCGAVLWFAAIPARANEVLQGSLAGWTSGGPPAAAVFPERGEAAVLAEYGFVSFESRAFSRGADTVDAAVYKTKDPSGAYGLYSFLRTADMPHANFTDHSSMSRDRALVLVGNLVLDVRGHDLTKFEPDIKFLVAALSPKAQEGPLPTLWQHLPVNDRIERSDHYFLGPVALNQFVSVAPGDWIGFSSGAEVETANYRLGGRDESLLIADFPTPQLAAQELAELQKKFKVNGSNRASASPALFASRSYTLLAIVSGAPSQTEANALLNQVKSGMELTWNEPTFQFKEPSIEAMILGTIIGACTICVFALVAGISFGGVRILVKRLWPGKVFDRSSHLQVLQLGLGSKPINSDDFYGYSPSTGRSARVDKNLPDRVALRIFR